MKYLDEIRELKRQGWQLWPVYIAADPDSKTFEYLSFGGILYYRWAS